jgi:hypothetical protein
VSWVYKLSFLCNFVLVLPSSGSAHFTHIPLKPNHPPNMNSVAELFSWVSRVNRYAGCLGPRLSTYCSRLPAFFRQTTTMRQNTKTAPTATSRFSFHAESRAFRRPGQPDPCTRSRIHRQPEEWRSSDCPHPHLSQLCNEASNVNLLKEFISSYHDTGSNTERAESKYSTLRSEMKIQSSVLRPCVAVSHLGESFIDEQNSGLDPETAWWLI